jgi:hypothetical protein
MTSKCDNDGCIGGRAWQTDESYELDPTKLFCSYECADKYVETITKPKSRVICTLFWNDDGTKKLYDKICELGNEPEDDDDDIFFYFDNEDPLKHDGEFTVVAIRKWPLCPDEEYEPPLVCGSVVDGEAITGCGGVTYMSEQPSTWQHGWWSYCKKCQDE